MSGPPSLDEELDGLFTGGLAHCRGMLVTSRDGRPFRPAGDLLSTDRLDEVLERFGRSRGDADRRAVASLWSQWYFGTLVPPALAAGLLLDRILPLGIGDVDVLLDEDDARPAAFRLHRPGRVDPDASPFERFEPLVRGHLSPLVETLAPHVGLSADTLWTNAGRYVQWILDEIGPPDRRQDELAEREGDEEPEGKSEREGEERSAASGRRLLDAGTWPDGWENRLHGTVRYVRDGGGRVPRRRVCCLQYLIPDLEGCGDLCPLPHVRAEESDAPS